MTPGYSRLVRDLFFIPNRYDQGHTETVIRRLKDPLYRVLKVGTYNLKQTPYDHLKDPLKKAFRFKTSLFAISFHE